jgi:hypothetical protein
LARQSFCVFTVDIPCAFNDVKININKTEQTDSTRNKHENSIIITVQFAAVAPATQISISCLGNVDGSIIQHLSFFSLITDWEKLFWYLPQETHGEITTFSTDASLLTATFILGELWYTGVSKMGVLILTRTRAY